MWHPEVEDWKDLRFGMFIHWGLYSILGRGEWVMFNEAIDVDEYRKLMYEFTAEHFDARAWARTAKNAGMKYMVLTTRHHDGFSLWDSKASWGNFTSMQTPAGRDFVAEYVEACRAEGLKVGLYYSPLDWRFPGFFFPKMYGASARALREQTYAQLRELLTNYGKIDILWFDGGEDFWLGHGRDMNSIGDRSMKDSAFGKNFWRGKELNDMIRELQPGIVVNNRFGNREYGDFGTPEGRIGAYNTEEPWESCFTINGSWGWIPNRPPHSLRECIRMLACCATGDGNLLMNVGPRADGTMEETDIKRLGQVGAWLEKYGASIYGTRGGPFPNNACMGMTHRDNTLYVHVWDWRDEEITLPRLHADILGVRSLTASSLVWRQEDGRIVFSVDEADRMAPDTVLEITLDRKAAEAATGETEVRETEFHRAAIVEDTVL